MWAVDGGAIYLSPSPSITASSVFTYKLRMLSCCHVTQMSMCLVLLDGIVIVCFCLQELDTEFEKLGSAPAVQARFMRSQQDLREQMEAKVSSLHKMIVCMKNCDEDRRTDGGEFMCKY